MCHIPYPCAPRVRGGAASASGASAAVAALLGCACARGSRAFLSLRESLHSCFLERSQQHEAYRQFCLLQPVHAAASLRMLAASAGFPLQNIDAQRQQGRQPWGQPTEGLCTTHRAGSACRAHPPPPAGLCAGRRAGNPSLFMCAHGLHRAVCVRCPCCSGPLTAGARAAECNASGAARRNFGGRCL
eukprot:SAG25_NODE_2089_length_1964_cov_13.859517_2_plen_187_part_00